MLIGIDMSLTAEAKTGLPSYARSLVAALARQDTRNDYLLYPFVWHSFPPHYERAFCPQQHNFRLARRRMPRWLVKYLWEKPNVSKDWLIGGDPDVYFSPFHSVPPRHFRRLVSVFHDIAFRIHPEFSTEVNRVYCEEQFNRATRLADKLVTVSHFSKAEMVKHMGVPEDWIRVTHEAADPRFKRIADSAIPERIRADIDATQEFVLYVGSVEPRKNLATLIRAFDTMMQRGRTKPLLIIAGGSGWKNSAVYEEIDRRRLKDHVYFTGLMTDAELLALYNTATLFVYPSIYEGFGLPVIEAMSCGVPVVTTRVASIPEVGGEAVAYVDDPMDDEGLGWRMEELLLDAEHRRDLCTKGLERAATFTWDRTAQETLAILEEVHAGPEYHRSSLRMGQDERALDKGWHSLEVEFGKAFRWSQRHATLRMTRAGDSIAVEAATSMPDREQYLAVRVNGCLVGHAALEFDWREHRFPVPAGVPRDRPLEVALDVSFELPPAVKGLDTRQLGAKIARVEFS
ncbi:MAG: glycosyltransferase family 4 protein [Planctomycetota bacterium]|jgi:glycosyltransferase involved in cell wall biosynthesis